MRQSGSSLKGKKLFHKRGRCPDGSPNPIDVYVGQRIRLRRLLMGITQERLAHLLGITFQQIQKYERGMNRIGASRIWDISKVLKVDINFFFEDMPQTVAEQSPRNFSCDKDVLSGVDNEQLKTPLDNTNESQELLRNYYKIRDKKVAAQIFKLIKSLS